MKEVIEETGKVQLNPRCEEDGESTVPVKHVGQCSSTGCIRYLSELSDPELSSLTQKIKN